MLMVLKGFRAMSEVTTGELRVHRSDLGWIVVHYKGHKVVIVHFESHMVESNAL